MRGLAMLKLQPGTPGLPPEYAHPAHAMVLELCEVRGWGGDGVGVARSVLAARARSSESTHPAHAMVLELCEVRGWDGDGVGVARSVLAARALPA